MHSVGFKIQNTLSSFKQSWIIYLHC